MFLELRKLHSNGAIRGYHLGAKYLLTPTSCRRIKTNIRSLATADTHKLRFTFTANTAYFVHRIDFTTNAQEKQLYFYT